MADDSKIPRAGSVARQSWARRSARKAPSTPGQRPQACFGGEDSSREKLDERHAETAAKMVATLGQMKGAAMKIGQFASFIDIDFIPEVPRDLPGTAGETGSEAPSMPGKRSSKVLKEEYDGEPIEQLFDSIRARSFRRRLDRPGPPRPPDRRTRGRRQDPVPGDRRGAGVGSQECRDAGADGPGARPGLDAEVTRELREGAGRARLRIQKPRTSVPSPAPTVAIRSSTSPM